MNQSTLFSNLISLFVERKFVYTFIWAKSHLCVSHTTIILGHSLYCIFKFKTKKKSIILCLFDFDNIYFSLFPFVSLFGFLFSNEIIKKNSKNQTIIKIKLQKNQIKLKTHQNKYRSNLLTEIIFLDVVAFLSEKRRNHHDKND